MKAILINRNDDKSYYAQYEDIAIDQLPEGDVTVDVEYSTLNYKDSLAITGKSPIAKILPLVPGIDLAGCVSHSDHSDYKVGDKVVLNGWGVGEGHWGGLAEQARLKGEWLVPLPEKFNTSQAMAIGTAGYTAMLCVMALEEAGTKPSDGEILVTGAAGGVGSVAVAVLAKLGYQVVASTGREAEEAYLKDLGAQAIIARSELSEKGRPLAKERWAGAIDCVGSYTLANVCAAMKRETTVAACGLAQGFDFPATVMPFILRGVTLRGIDSVYCSRERRIAAWNRLALDLDVSKLDMITQEIGLSQAIETASLQLAGKIRGRVVVDVKS